MDAAPDPAVMSTRLEGWRRVISKIDPQQSWTLVGASIATVLDEIAGSLSTSQPLDTGNGAGPADESGTGSKRASPASDEIQRQQKRVRQAEHGSGSCAFVTTSGPTAPASMVSPGPSLPPGVVARQSSPQPLDVPLSQSGAGANRVREGSSQDYAEVYRAIARLLRSGNASAADLGHLTDTGRAIVRAVLRRQLTLASAVGDQLCDAAKTAAAERMAVHIDGAPAVNPLGIPPSLVDHRRLDTPGQDPPL
eukprot:m.469044 g.469044  ORF g.469044 m.469044 type:complete len:251 (-) comp28056_c0_seq1:418-1170(-)